MDKALQPDIADNARAFLRVRAEHVAGLVSQSSTEAMAIEEPLEIQLGYGAAGKRVVKPISVTMRTPGDDFELAAGFLMTEGVVRDLYDIERIAYVEFHNPPSSLGGIDQSATHFRSRSNIVRVDICAEVPISLANLERNFYTTSSCGICGKASLLALRSICPPLRRNDFAINAKMLYALPTRMRQAQSVFDRTGGLHAAGLFTSAGELLGVYEDVGRHNAVDKLLGRELLADRIPVRDTLLLLSGRASFELLQKAVMGGVSMVASVGAPSSLAVHVAREFDIALVGFLRDDHFNVYHGAWHLAGLTQQADSRE